MKEKRLKKQHPFAMLSKLTASALLLLLPVLQQILYRPQNLFEIISSMGLSAIYVIIIISGAIVFYNTCRYKSTSLYIYLERGIPVKRSFTIPFCNVSTITVERSIIAAAFGAARISVDTPAGFSKKRDISLYLSRSKINRIISKLFDGFKTKYIYTVSNARMLMMSALWSNPMSGLIIFAPLIQKTGNILGEEFNRAVMESVDFRINLISIGITPAAATIANILVFGWIIALVFQFFRYARFSSRRVGEYIAIKRGIGRKNERYTKLSEISAVTIDRTLSMALMQLTSVGIFSIGSNKDRGDKSLIALAADSHELKNAVSGLTSFDTHYEQKIRPDKSRLFSYIMIPLIVTAIVLALVSLLMLVPLLDDLYFTALLISLIPLVWWIAFRVFAFKHASLGLNNSCAILCGYKRLSLKKYVVPYRHIQFIETRQNLWQRHTHYCSVRVYLYYEKRACYTVKQLKLSEAEELLRIIDLRCRETRQHMA